MSDKVEKIGIGTVQFGSNYGISNTTGKTPAAEVTRILKTAQKCNIHLLDTASAYGDSEKILGMNPLDSFRIVSKFMPPTKNEPIENQLRNSLSDLGVASLYGYLAHRPAELIGRFDHWEELQNFKQKNLVEKIGFSFDTPEELQLLLKQNFIPDIIQVPYNYFDRRFEQWMISLKEKGCEIHARSAFLQGLFFLKTSELNSYFDPVKPVIDSLQNQVRNLPGTLLNFVLKKPFIDCVIIGVENEKQLTANLGSLPDDEVLPEQELQIPDYILIPSKWPENP